MKIILQGYILVPDADLANIRIELPRHIELTRKEKGCIVFEVTQNKDNKNRFDVYEEFMGDEAFMIHQQRVSQSRWGEISDKVTRYYSVK